MDTYCVSHFADCPRAAARRAENVVFSSAAIIKDPATKANFFT